MLAALSIGRGRPFILGPALLILITLYVYYSRIAPADLALASDDKPPRPPAAPPVEGSGDIKDNYNNNNFQQQQQDAAPPGQKPLLPMSYGTTARPPLKGMGPLLADLPPELVPSRAGGGRLVIVGDVHGQRAALEALLAEVGFSADRGDHLVLAGDLVSKGPDSAGVVALAMRLGASAVRGNHDDRVLLAHAAMHGGVGLEAVKEAAQRNRARGEGPAATAAATPPPPPPPPSDGPEDTLEEDPFSHGDYADKATARTLTAEQLDWLARQPVILHVGPVPPAASSGEGGGDGAGGIADLVVVHAGLVPGVPLDRQDPWAVMNMRSLAYPVDGARRAAARAGLEAAARAAGARPPLRIPDAAVDAEAERLRALSVAASPTGTDDERDAVALPVEGRRGTPWAEAWDAWQRRHLPGDGDGDGARARRVTVVYGHDARRGLRVEEGSYALGLDSGCVYGRRLSALVVEAAAGGGARRRVVQVDCEKAKSA